LLPLIECDNQSRAALIWTHPEEQLQTVLSWDDQTFIHHLQQRFGHRAGKIIGVGKRQGYPLQLMQVIEQVRSNVVIMGNAAHCLHPVAGQGFNLALRDCATLVDVLTHAHQQGMAIGDYKTLAVYERRQSLDQQITIGLTHQLVKQFSSHSLPLVILRQLGLLTLNALPTVHRRFAQQLMGQQVCQ
jgi:2-octaprenylphenol hydroxylase